MKKKLLYHACLLACFNTTVAYADCRQQTFDPNYTKPDTNELFGATICNDKYGQVIYGGNNVEGLIEQFDQAQLRQQFPEFNENVDSAFFEGNFRGVPILAAFPEEHGDRLVFKVPELGICKEWGNGAPQFCRSSEKSAGNREANKDKLEDYLKKEGDKILRELVKASAVDPIAGNPSSQQSQTVADEFNAGTDNQYDVATGETMPNRLGIGARFGSYSLGDKSVTAYTLPLSYKVPLSPDQELIFRLPITYTTVEGARSYRVATGVSYKKSVTEVWSLAPSISYGMAGSRDLGSAAHSISTSLTSNYVLPISTSKYEVSIGNMVGYYKTLPFKIQDYEVDLDITNVVLRNGLSLSIPLGKKLVGQELSLETFVVDTRFTGDELYIDQYQEIGFSIGPKTTKGKAGFSGQEIGIGFQYLRAEGGNNGFTFNLGYEF